MSEHTPKYITTTLPYVNDKPHMGHALEFVQADSLARYWRLMGREVFFNTGVDEHGQKIARKADEAGIPYQEYVDKYAAEFNKLKEALDLSYDAFIRTTDPAHEAAAQEMWRRCAARGDIYKKKYKGLYCVGCEAFKTETDLVDGKCPDHQKEPEEIEEENYFFKLSNYQDYLIEHLSKEGVVVPDFRRHEAINFVQGGLEDLSISREKKRMSWGIPVPGDDAHVMYVWFDALTNYISTLGWPEDTDGIFKKFWAGGETLQFAGKDQIRFQSLIWQAMLQSAGVEATDTVFYHGFITSGGHKMSKSIGNVIDPYDLVARYGTDATRYIMLRHVHPTDDSDLTWEKMDEYYTANLVNGLGNLTARIMKMAETHLDEPVAKPETRTFDAEFYQMLGELQFQAACDIIWKAIGELDERITNEEPFKVVKEDKEKGQQIIRELATGLYNVGRVLHPIMPTTGKIIKEAVLANKKPENLFGRLDETGG
ncbi:methionine--tRNA ligase [Candidatus Kaiserbacteria bacterium]|nr:methionine--tRNA ligase [Candidatus Kaiserbacteria bacterium]